LILKTNSCLLRRHIDVTIAWVNVTPFLAAPPWWHRCFASWVGGLVPSVTRCTDLQRILHVVVVNLSCEVAFDVVDANARAFVLPVRAANTTLCFGLLLAIELGCVHAKE
jgi:hypothetical protein